MVVVTPYLGALMSPEINPNSAFISLRQVSPYWSSMAFRNSILTFYPLNNPKGKQILFSQNFQNISNSSLTLSLTGLP